METIYMLIAFLGFGIFVFGTALLKILSNENIIQKNKNENLKKILSAGLTIALIAGVLGLYNVVLELAK